MSIHIYHPNKTSTGFACSFWYSSKHQSTFATLIKQSGYNSTTQNGIFKDNLNDPTKKISIKLSCIELGAILDCIERNRPFSTFHDQDDFPKTIKFEPWMSKTENPVQRGFSFNVTITNKKDSEYKNSFYIGLTFAEARYIREYLIYLLKLSFEKQNKETASESIVDSSVKQEVIVNNESEPPVSNTDPLTGF